ncbi:YafY family protein [Geobacter sp. SVR]|uniref:helix-turn-helix transcriptional regulator n=1 Tax=Geobacter sp. SVR TaxID=2495594 RepID=UPI00143EF80B|nr:WYL domain-containing protein [Geobacter sp. SVR]BCS52157.1 transcriptional regulator [Geobacter sp. SVR]GCF86612.1 transcriptional regulator [Geobacter sp. SVR]
MQKGKPAKKYSQAGRLHTIIRLLEARRGMTLDDLAEECGVDRRTIHRDLNAVEEAGYTLTSEWQEGRKVYGFLTRSRNIPPITFTLQQLMSLYLLRSLGAHLGGTPFQAGIDELFRSITSVLPDRYVAHLERIARVSLPLLHGARDYSAAAGHVEELQRALLHQYRIRLDYAKKGRGRAESYELDPYTLVFHKGGIYLLGLAHNRKGVRLFALERIRGIEVTRQRFEMPEGYRPENHFTKAFGLVNEQPVNVKARFSAEVAHTVMGRLWMPGQSVASDREGRVTIAFEAAGKMELISWILSYGVHAELLEPPEWRREIKQQLRGMREFYRKKEKKAGIGATDFPGT